MTTGGGTGCIAAHANARAGLFEALVVPGEIGVRVEVGGKSFIYTPAAGKMPGGGKGEQLHGEVERGGAGRE